MLKISFNDYAVQQTGVNSAFSYNYKNAITGIFPDFTIDYSKALVSRGLLPNAAGPAVTLGTGNVLTWSWTDNTGGDAKATDTAILVAYCEAMRQAIYTTNGGTRSELTGDLDVSTFAGEVVETYIGFISEDGRLVSVSNFTGEVTLVV